MLLSVAVVCRDVLLSVAVGCCDELLYVYVGCRAVICSCRVKC